MRQPYTAIVGPQATNEPIGAILSVGYRVPGSSGAPQKKGQFWVLQPTTQAAEFNRRGGGGKYNAIYRPLHPEYEAWNVERDDGWTRSHVDGMIVGASRGSSLRQCYRCAHLADPPPSGDVPGGGTWDKPPGYQPACTGNGAEAQRFHGVDDNGQASYRTIACRGETCAFRQRPDPTCKRQTELLFRPEWPEQAAKYLPTHLMRWISHGEESAANAAGLFGYVERLAAENGVTVQSWAGLRFTMSLASKRDPARGRRWPVVAFALRSDVVKWIIDQQRQLAELRALELPPPSAEEQDTEAAALTAAPVVEINVPGQAAGQAALFDAGG